MQADESGPQYATPDSRRGCLVVCAACRRLEERLAEWPGAMQLIEMAERFADGLISDRDAELATVAAECWASDRRADRQLGHANPLRPLRYLAPHYLPQGAWAGATQKVLRKVVPKAHRAAADRAWVEISRDVYGPPAGRSVMEPRWRTPAVVAQARCIYEELTFSQLPELAEALVDAGCDSAEILAHCRSEGPHVRGCWVVDLMLAKE